jgi:hypothetical protein
MVTELGTRFKGMGMGWIWGVPPPKYPAPELTSQQKMEQAWETLTISTDNSEEVLWYKNCVFRHSFENEDYQFELPKEAEIIHDFVTGSGVFVSAVNRPAFAQDFDVRTDQLHLNLPRPLQQAFAFFGDQERRDPQVKKWVSENGQNTLATIQRQAVLGSLRDPKSGLQQVVRKIRETPMSYISYWNGEFIEYPRTTSDPGNTCVPEKTLLCLLLKLIITYTETPVTDSKGEKKPFVLETIPQSIYTDPKTKLPHPEYITSDVEKITLSVMEKVLLPHITATLPSSYTKKLAKSYISRYKQLSEERAKRISPTSFIHVSVCELESIASGDGVFDAKSLFQNIMSGKRIRSTEVPIYNTVEWNSTNRMLKFTLLDENQGTRQIETLKDAKEENYKLMGFLAAILLTKELLQDEEFLKTFFKVIGAYAVNIIEPNTIFERVAYENSEKKKQ